MSDRTFLATTALIMGTFLAALWWTGRKSPEIEFIRDLRGQMYREAEQHDDMCWCPTCSVVAKDRERTGE